MCYKNREKMGNLRAEDIAEIKQRLSNDVKKLEQIQQELIASWSDVNQYILILRERRILEGRIFIHRIKISNLQKGREVLSA